MKSRISNQNNNKINLIYHFHNPNEPNNSKHNKLFITTKFKIL